MKLRDLKPGDKFTITSVPVMSVNSTDGNGVWVSGLNPNLGGINLLSGDIEVTRAIPEPAIGQVWAAPNNDKREIIGIYGDVWWMKNLATGSLAVWRPECRERGKLAYVSG